MENTEQPHSPARHLQHVEDVYEMKLYVAGNNKKSQLALANLKDICHKYLAGKCHIEVIDLKTNPGLARTDQIVAVPTLIIKNCSGKRIIGNLSDPKKVLEIMDVRTSNLIGVINEKGSIEKNSAEESKAGMVKSKRSKDDLQPYIGSGLFRQQSQNLDKWLFSLSHSPC